MSKRSVTKKVARELADKVGIDLDVVGLDQWQQGIKVELEHGNGRHKRTDVTHNNLLMTAKIAAAHLDEYPDYYVRLERMERQAEKYWARRDKPCVFK